MADIAVENKETPVVEKEVDDETPKVSEAEEVDVGKAVENGLADAEEASENGIDKDDDDEDESSLNEESTDAPAEAVKRKGDAVEDTPAEDAATPEKKAKLDDSAAKEVEENGAEEVAA